MEILALALIIIIAIRIQAVAFKKLVFKKLDYKCAFSVSEAHEGDDIFLVETVLNKKLLPIPWLKIEIHSSRWLDFAGTRSYVAQESRHVTSNFLLRSYQKTTRKWKLKCLKRGVYSTENVTLVAGDPLGITTNSIPYRVDANIVVYPELVSLEDLFTPSNYLQGETVIKRWIVDDPFMISGVREYTPWDSMDKIHWGATAKAGHLMVKKNDFTSQVSLTIILNIQSQEFEYQSVLNRKLIELGIKVAATLLDRALRKGIPVRLATNGCTIDDNRNMIFTGEASGRDHVCELLKILAKLELKNIRDFENLLEDISDNIRNNEVVLISSYLNEEICNQARALKRGRNSVSIILLHSAENLNLPGDLDIYFLSGVETTNAREN